MPSTLAVRTAQLAAKLRTRAEPHARHGAANRADLAELADLAEDVPEPAPAETRARNRRLAGRVLALLGAVWLGYLLTLARRG